MSEKHYWFPVRPARNGWGWGLPVAWQGWVVYLAFFALLIGGMIVISAYGIIPTLAFAGCWGGAFTAVVIWKGEPQRMRDDSSL